MSELLELQQTEYQDADGWVSIKPADRVTTVLKCCQELAKIGSITGPSGIGKTAALERYAAADRSRVVLCTMSPAVKTQVKGLLHLCGALGVNNRFDSIKGADDAKQHIRAFLKNKHVFEQWNCCIGGLVIFDEAQYMNEDLLEDLREISETLVIGMVFCGNDYSASRFAAAAKHGDYLEQYSTRVFWRGKLKPPSDDDIRRVCHSRGVHGKKEVQLLTTAAKGGGWLRTVLDIIEGAQFIYGPNYSPTIDQLTSAAKMKGVWND